MQLHENTAALSHVAATLTGLVKVKSFVCHSYKKHGGGGSLPKHWGKRTPSRSGQSVNSMPTAPDKETRSKERNGASAVERIRAEASTAATCWTCRRVSRSLLTAHCSLLTVSPTNIPFTSRQDGGRLPFGNSEERSEPNRSTRSSSFSLRLGRPPQHAHRSHRSARRTRPNENRTLLSGKDFDGKLQSSRLPLSLAP